MCTISIVPHGAGVRVVCNRDERRDRSAALAPVEYQVGSGRALFPRDPDGGGTWIGVNRAGLIAALLNRNPCRGDVPQTRRAAAQHLTSRGVIVPCLLQFEQASHALAHLNRLSPHAFAAFRAVLVEGPSVWAAAGGDGLSLEVQRFALAQPHVFSSSSLGDAVVEAPRRRLFAQLIARCGGATLAAQAMFHRHRWPHRSGVSVLMSRPEARTVSRTQVDIVRAGTPASMRYEALPDVREGSHPC